jgi:hypothetical protein
METDSTLGFGRGRIKRMGGIGFTRGAWQGAASLLIGGALGVVSAPETSFWQPVLGWVSIALGLLLALWAIEIRGEHWWRRAWRTWRCRRNEEWWVGVQSFSIRGFSCLATQVPERDFESSPRAIAIANEIRGIVNSGHMPLMLEDAPWRQVGSPPGPPYDRKNVTVDAVLSKKKLESLAQARGWPLPWPVKSQLLEDIDTVTRAPKLTNGLAGLIASIASPKPTQVEEKPHESPHARALRRAIEGDDEGRSP